jgi:probable poly-beta-1,6-N-acetyl-D-glucosamine export protein
MARRLLLLNGIAIVCVILFHAAGWSYTAMFAWVHRYNGTVPVEYGASYYTLRLVEQFVQFCIPAFLFVSGYFVAFMTGSKRKTLEWKVVATRVKFLVIPYLLWSLLLILANFAQGRTNSPIELARMILTGATNPAYYFVPLLIQFYLIAPLVVPIVRAHWKLALVVTGILQLIVSLLQYPAVLNSGSPALVTAALMLPKWLFITRIFWFVLGIAVGFHLAQMKGALERMRWVLLALIPVLYVVGYVEWEWLVRLSGQNWIETRETVVDLFYALVVLLGFMAWAATALPANKTLEDLGGRSYGIYLVHSPVMEFFSRGVYHLAPALLAFPLVLFVALIVLGLGIPVLLMYLVNHSPARQLYSYQFG